MLPRKSTWHLNRGLSTLFSLTTYKFRARLPTLAHRVQPSSQPYIDPSSILSPAAVWEGLTHRVVSPVYVITHEQIVCVRCLPAYPEQLHEVVKLPMHIPAHRHRAPHRLDIGLFQQNIACLCQAVEMSVCGMDCFQWRIGVQKASRLFCVGCSDQERRMFAATSVDDTHNVHRRHAQRPRLINQEIIACIA